MINNRVALAAILVLLTVGILGPFLAIQLEDPPIVIDRIGSPQSILGSDVKNHHWYSTNPAVVEVDPLGRFITPFGNGAAQLCSYPIGSAPPLVTCTKVLVRTSESGLR